MASITGGDGPLTPVAAKATATVSGTTGEPKAAGKPLQLLDLCVSLVTDVLTSFCPRFLKLRSFILQHRAPHSHAVRMDHTSKSTGVTPITLMLMLAQCGCGVQSLSVAVWRAFCGVGPASAATCVTMIDQSQRAVRFAKFNSLLNDVTSAVYCGDATDASSLLSPLPTFDAVLINPP
eukprot:COSAG06_NODE_1296_length_9960_cov_2.570009_9_plen_178_part_00